MNAYMNAKIDDANALKAYETLRASGPRGRELAGVLDARATRVRVTPRIYGGFTLNFINTIFIMPLRENASDWDYKFWVTLLGHEACHIEQRYWIDSVAQEIRAYTTQARVGDDVGIDLDHIKRAFVNLDPENAEHQILAHAALVGMFAGTSVGILYASLPLFQPTGFGAIVPGARQIVAAIRAGLAKPQT